MDASRTYTAIGIAGGLLAGGVILLAAPLGDRMWGRSANAAPVVEAAAPALVAELPPGSLDHARLATTVQPGAIADAALLDRVRADKSAAFATNDPLTIAEAVRDWVYVNVDRSNLTDSTLDPLQFQLSYGQVLELLDRDEGGFQCGGTAVILAGIYRALGYEATTLNFGPSQATGGLTHVVTLVKLKAGERDILSVQDAYFGYSLKLNSQPADVRDVIAALADKRFADIEVVDAPKACRQVIARKANATSQRGEFSPHYAVNDLTSRSPNMTKFCAGISLAGFTEKDPAGRAYLDYLVSVGLPRNFFYTMLIPIGEYPADVQASVDAARAKLRVPDSVR